MQIVIDIPNRIYKIIQHKTLNIMDAEILEKAVKNGIPLNDVLDKIRAEIEKPLHDERCFDTADAKAQYIALNWCIEIIDKYKAESEG